MRYSQKNLYLPNVVTFTAPGSGTAYQIDQPNTASPVNYSMFVTVTNINTNVIVRLDGSVDATNFAPVISGQTITADGTYFYSLQNTPLKNIQPVFVSESGGTAAVVSFSIAAGN
jgi:hypothetical protein